MDTFQSQIHLSTFYVCINAVHQFEMVVAFGNVNKFGLCIFFSLAERRNWNTTSESLCLGPDVIFTTSSDWKIDTEFEGLLVCFMANYVQIWMLFVYFFFDKSFFYQKVLCLSKPHFLKIILWSCESSVWVWLSIPPVIDVYVPYIDSL